ncbi:MAG: acetyl-CoA carboxylase biotin carboxylase subunit [Candidatus Eisenbacteria bacterium]|nr:acetyl-CoA carboxylase biotin carboxylase subunit [Candidatus Eisenbacteria bacterium]
MFRRILIANRGEIAVRIIRAARELGIRTVAVYSEADRESLPVRLADEAVCIGPARSQDSYLSIPSIISACRVAGADAVHPGYGFLAENYRFAEACEGSGITFIGPPAEVIRRMGDKAAAKEAMRAAGVPVTPGSDGVVADLKTARREAERCGYPVLLKAREGGGGKGMRVVRAADGLAGAFETATAEARAAFGNGELYLEKFIVDPRHIEVQLAGDAQGNVAHFFERDCSIQRRHQKLVEESPSPALDAETRQRIGAQAVRGAAEIGYRSLGTMEFLLSSEGEFYFMEMNTRLQVEHCVSEEVTGWDLVKLQIALAADDPLPVRQSEIEQRGHAIECRINAEDPLRGFTPSPGRVAYFHPPGGPGVRLDTHVYSGYQIPPYYDSLIGKLIAVGRTRPEALARMRGALAELLVEGVATTAPFHDRVMRDAHFVRGVYDTGSAERIVAELAAEAHAAERSAIHAPEEQPATGAKDDVAQPGRQ